MVKKLGIDLDALRALGKKVRDDAKPAVKSAYRLANEKRAELLGAVPTYELSLASASSHGGAPLYQVTIYAAPTPGGRRGKAIETLHGEDLPSLKRDAEQWCSDVGAKHAWRD